MDSGFERTTRVFAAKTRTELARLAKKGVLTVGNAFSSVVLVKGVPNEAERDGGGVLAGTDGMALRAALSKLGYAPEDWCGLACWDANGGLLSPELLRLALATLDPATVVACDDVAATLVCNAFLGDLFSLEVGRVTILDGMRVLTLGGFEAALGSMPAKQLMWARLKQIPPLAEPY
ncbi:MAG: hypothetical protein IKG21_08015 [Atopobiaceae bacterium]|nr:hypothetical protein [Atopobiaceae bacterium]